MILIAIANEQRFCRPDRVRMRRAVRAILGDAGYVHARISIALVDEARIHEVNRQFLEHDYPTDVITFDLSDFADRLEGEIVASAETACREAERRKWSPQAELLLYIIHGALHLVGHDDQTPVARRAMRKREAAYLAQLEVSPPERGVRAKVRRRKLRGTGLVK